MKIAIVGAGMTGAYLYRLLDKAGHIIDIFDNGPGTRCGINPCAWGTSGAFDSLVEAAGLDPSRYALTRCDHLVMDGLRIKADLMTFDKPGLIRDLLNGARVDHSGPDIGSYDRVIDATGVSRAFLPLIRDDVILACTQLRVQGNPDWDNRIKLGRVGYAWCFPLTGNRYHMGCGSLVSDPRSVLRGLGWMEGVPGTDILCRCAGAVRLTGPEDSRPFYSVHMGTEIWGVGEAIGCVAPLAGDGVIPGMVSVRILIEHWDDPAGYTRAILKEFQWMSKERVVIDKLRKNEAFGIGDAWVLKKNSRRMGMDVGLKEAALLLRHLR